MPFKIVNKNDPAFKEQQRQAWQRISQGGKAKFVLKRGLLVWGGMMFIILAGLNAIFLYRTDHMDYLPVLLLANAVIWSLCGLLWGFWVWNKGEKLFSASMGSSSRTNKKTD